MLILRKQIMNLQYRAKLHDVRNLVCQLIFVSFSSMYSSLAAQEQLPQIVDRAIPATIELAEVNIANWGDKPDLVESEFGHRFERRIDLQRLQMQYGTDSNLDLNISVTVRTPSEPNIILKRDDREVLDLRGKVLSRESFVFADGVVGIKSDLLGKDLRILGKYLFFGDRFVAINVSCQSKRSRKTTGSDRSDSRWRDAAQVTLSNNSNRGFQVFLC